MPFSPSKGLRRSRSQLALREYDQITFRDSASSINALRWLAAAARSDAGLIEAPISSVALVAAVIPDQADVSTASEALRLAFHLARN